MSTSASETGQADPQWEPERVGAVKAPSRRPSPFLEGQTRCTLVFLAAVLLTTFGAWGAGKLACNYHPQRTEQFEVAPLEKLVQRPKDAALEFHHSLFLQKYDRALEIALERGADLIVEAREACDQACKQELEHRLKAANSRAILLSIEGRDAWVRVETFMDGQEVFTDEYRLSREYQRWLVVGRADPLRDQ